MGKGATVTLIVKWEKSGRITSGSHGARAYSFEETFDVAKTLHLRWSYEAPFVFSGKLERLELRADRQS